MYAGKLVFAQVMEFAPWHTFTGLSPHEALALGWEHIDLEAGELRVVRTLDVKTRVLMDATKRESRKRTVPLAPEPRTMLLERHLAAGRPPEGLVFAEPLGQPLSLDHLRSSHFQPTIEAAEIKRRVRIYDLRHGFATAALEGGVDVVTVSKLLGHSSVTTTMDVYQHVSPELKREAVHSIAGRLLGC